MGTCFVPTYALDCSLEPLHDECMLVAGFGKLRTYADRYAAKELDPSVTEYFQRGQRGQWAGEGYIMSVIAVLIGLAYLILNNVPQIFDDKYQMRVTIYSLIATIWIGQQLYLAAYRIKSPWYKPTFSPPDYYLEGSLMMD